MKSLELSSSSLEVGGDTVVHEVVDDDCVMEPLGCAGEVKELGASRRSGSRQSIGVVG